MWPRKKRCSILSRRPRLRGPTALQPGPSMNGAASNSAAGRSCSGSSGLTSGTQGQAPGALAEAQLDQQRPNVRADHGLAVEALDAQARQPPAAHLLRHGVERFPEAVVVLIAQGQQPL